VNKAPINFGNCVVWCLSEISGTIVSYWDIYQTSVIWRSVMCYDMVVSYTMRWTNSGAWYWWVLRRWQLLGA